MEYVFKTLRCKNTEKSIKLIKVFLINNLYCKIFARFTSDHVFKQIQCHVSRQGCNAFLNYLFQYTAYPGTFLYNNSHYFEGFLGVAHYNF